MSPIEKIMEEMIGKMTHKQLEAYVAYARER